MLSRKKLCSPTQNAYLETIATRFDGTHSNFLLGSCQLPGARPIVYCSDGFCELTGYSRSEIMQKNSTCEFLYGSETSPDATNNILDALEHKDMYKGDVTLYRKNGCEFSCLVDIVPIENDNDLILMLLISFKEIEMGGCTDNGIMLDNTRRNTNEFPLLTIEDDSVGSSCAEEYNRQRMQRRRSRAVLYNLSGHLKGQSKHKRRPKCLSAIIDKLCGNDAFSLLEKNNGDEKQRFTISYRNSWKTTWDCIIFLLTLYVAAIVPYYVALQALRHGMNTKNAFNEKLRNPVQAFDIVLEIAFLIDILLNFRTTFVDKSGRVEVNPRAIAINYLKTWFIIDLIAGIPFDIISLCFNINLVNSQSLQLIKAVRLLRLFRILHKLDKWSQYTPVILISLILLFGMLAHWLACCWFSIGWSEYNSQIPDNENGVGWIYELSDVLNKPFRTNSTGGPDSDTSYLTALYFTMSSLTSVGFGNVSANTNREKIFSICVMMIGALMHALVFGNVTAIIQRMYARRSHFDTKMKEIKDFIKVHRIPKPIKQRMIDHFQTTWKRNNGVNELELLGDFPQSIRVDVAMTMHKELLDLPVFQRATQGCRRFISLHLSRSFASPMEVVVHDGDPLDYVYLVCSGSLQVLNNEIVTAILGKGDLFGANIDNEVILTSNADVKALTYCEIQCVTKECLLKVIRMYPQYAETLMQGIRCDFSCDLWSIDEDDDVMIEPISFNKQPLYTSATFESASNEEDEEEEAKSPDRSNVVWNLEESETDEDEIPPPPPPVIIKSSPTLSSQSASVIVNSITGSMFKSTSKSCLRQNSKEMKSSAVSNDKKVTFNEVPPGNCKSKSRLLIGVTPPVSPTASGSRCNSPMFNKKSTLRLKKDYSDTDSMSSVDSFGKTAIKTRRRSHEVFLPQLYANKLHLRRNNSCKVRSRQKISGLSHVKKHDSKLRYSSSTEVDKHNSKISDKLKQSNISHSHNTEYIDLLCHFEKEFKAMNAKIDKIMQQIGCGKDNFNTSPHQSNKTSKITSAECLVHRSEKQFHKSTQTESNISAPLQLVASNSSAFHPLYSTSAPASLCSSPQHLIQQVTTYGESCTGTPVGSVKWSERRRGYEASNCQNKQFDTVNGPSLKVQFSDTETTPYNRCVSYKTASKNHLKVPNLTNGSESGYHSTSPTLEFC